MATKWRCPSCKKYLSHHLETLAQLETPCCPYCKTPLDPVSVWQAEGDADTKMGCGLGSVITLGGMGLAGYVVNNYPAFANIEIGWRWLVFAVPLVAGIAVTVLYLWFAERRRERIRKQAELKAAPDRPRE